MLIVKHRVLSGRLRKPTYINDTTALSARLIYSPRNRKKKKEIINLLVFQNHIKRSYLLIKTASLARFKKQN